MTDRFLPFLLTVALIELTPGPNMAYLALVASRIGRRAGFVTVAGITAGLAIYLVASVFGLAAAAAQWPWLLAVLRWTGVAYVVWLAIDTWRPGREEAPPGAGGMFLRGLLNNLLNPKAAVFYVALLPEFLEPGAGSQVLQALTLGGLHIAVSVAVHGGIVLSADRAKPVFDRWSAQGGSRRVRAAFALALLGVAVWLALTDLSRG